MTFSGKRGSYRLVAVGWLLALLLLSFLPAHWKGVLHTKGRFHDAAHMVVFGLLAWLMAQSARTREGKIAALCLAAATGFAVELGQDVVFWFQLRVHAPVEWTDVLMDLMAVVLVGVVTLGIAPTQQGPQMRLRGSRG